MLEIKTRMGQGGRIVIPASFRKVMELNPGDDVIVILDEGQLRIMTPMQAVARAQALVRQFIPEETSLVEELMGDRRADSARE